MVYETRGAARALGAIRAALGDTEGLVLATDPDREGEAIAWQVLTWLREKDALADKPVERVAGDSVRPAAEICQSAWRDSAPSTCGMVRAGRREVQGFGDSNESFVGS